MQAKPSSFMRIVRGLLQEEGLKTLWRYINKCNTHDQIPKHLFPSGTICRGNVAAMALWTTYTAVQFPLYAALKRRLAAAAPVRVLHSLPSHTSLPAIVVPCRTTVLGILSFPSWQVVLLAVLQRPSRTLSIGFAHDSRHKACPR
jgi:hypothetical protein